MRSKVNLHVHTTFSDGGKTVAEVVEGLSRAGVEWFSITDHDEVRGNAEAARLAGQYGLRHVNGVELSCCFLDGEIDFDESYVCHLVGLGFDFLKMQIELLRLADEKNNKLHELCYRLIKDGYAINLKNIENENGKIAERKRVASELIRQKYAADPNEAFAKILNSDKYMQYAKNVPSIREGIKIIKQCGGIAVWAHPFSITRGGKKFLNRAQVSKLFVKMCEYGIDGIEVFYQKFDAPQIDFLRDLADGKGLIKSVGTDYHCVQFDEKKHPELLKYRRRESLAFDVDRITPDEGIISVVAKLSDIRE